MNDQATPSGGMTPEQRALYQRIDSHVLDAPDVPLPFSRRLAEREGWSHAHALRVISEYKRFVFLAMTAGHIATPSKAIDAAWHLHLEYTREYWDVFCAQVLHAPLHHDPGTGTPDEHAAFASLYQQTLDSYRKAFGEEAPEAIWPRPTESPATRTPRKPRSLLLETFHQLQIRRPALSRFARGLSPLASALLLTSCDNPHGLDVFNFPGPDFLRFYFALGAGVLIMLTLVHRALYRIQRWGSAKSEFLARDPLPHESAFLEGGTTRMVHVAVIEMMQAGLIKLTEKKGRAPDVELGSEFDGGTFMSECHWLRHMKNGRTSYPQFCRQLALRETDMIARFRSMGWWWNREDMRALKWSALILCTLTVSLGIAKAGVGIVRDRPIGYLVLSIVAFVIVYKIVRKRLPGLGRQGPTLAARTLLKAQADRWRPAPATPSTLLWKAALIGPAVLYGTPWAAHAEYFSMKSIVPVSSSSSGGSGTSNDSGGSGCNSSSCSSSSCSSGCGGCGSS